MRTLLFAGAYFGTAVRALALWAPEETIIPTHIADAVVPRPTLPPSSEALRRRQINWSSYRTLIDGPDRTCGYISGLKESSFACALTEDCVYLPGAYPATGFVGCCDYEVCTYRLACLDYGQVFSSSFCDQGCLVDTYTLKCTAATEPYCNTFSFPGDIYGYWCGSLSMSTAQLALTTYLNEADGRIFSTQGDDFGDTTTGDSTTTTTSSTSTSKRITVPTLGTVRTSSVTSTSSLAPTIVSPTPDSTPSPTSASGTSIPAGAIVGGVVGGLAVVGVVVLGIVYILRRGGTSPRRPGTPPLTGGPRPSLGPGTDSYSFYAQLPDDAAKDNSMVFVNGQPMTQAYGTQASAFLAQPYHELASPNGQAGYQPSHHARQGSIAPPTDGDHDTTGRSAPADPSMMAGAHQSYLQDFAWGQGHVRGHRGTISEVG